MKKYLFGVLLFSVLCILTGCSVDQKDLIGNWKGGIKVKSPNPDAHINAEISMYFEDSIELKGTMVIRWHFSHKSYVATPDTYVIPFIYKIEGNEIRIEGSGEKYTSFGSGPSGMVKFKLKYQGGNLKAENATIPGWNGKSSSYPFTLKKGW